MTNTISWTDRDFWPLKWIKIAAGDYSREWLARYPERLAARLGGRQASLEAAVQQLPSRLRNACARLLFTNKTFCRRVVAEMWFLRAKDAVCS
jgi:hypothetical protein